MKKLIYSMIMLFTLSAIGQDGTEIWMSYELKAKDGMAQTFEAAAAKKTQKYNSSACATILEQISACAPGANATTKAILFESLREPRAEALDFAAAGFAECMLGAEGLEGVAAFVEKRQPNWAVEAGETVRKKLKGAR